MSLEELERKRARLNKNVDITLRNMQIIADESTRVADVAHNSKKILNDLDSEFENMTGLKGQDIRFLFIATALQVLRIVVTNYITTIDKAGAGNELEEKLHSLQKKIFRAFNGSEDTQDKLFYASLNHIISTDGVPYDAQNFLTKKQVEKLSQKATWSFDIDDLLTENNGIFGANPGVTGGKGANHRFSTLGHDPILGLLFGTVNILTNTITCVGTPLIADKFDIPKVFTSITTNHVIYTEQKTTNKGIGIYTDPKIGVFAPTSVAIYKAADRAIEQPQALVAALIKQIIHIGTDMFTPCGIQLPAENLILSKKKVEDITKYISTGDIVKVQVSAKIAELINSIITAFHTLTFSEEECINPDIYSIRTKKIILYSNSIATSSNIIWAIGNTMAGNEVALKDIDFGGLLVLLKHLTTDLDFMQQIKEEFIFGSFDKMIQGEKLDLKEPDL